MVVDPAGPACPAGAAGCWERFASGAGLGMLARQAALAGRLDAVVAPGRRRSRERAGRGRLGRGRGRRPGGPTGDPRGRVLGGLRPGQPGLRHRSRVLRARRRPGRRRATSSSSRPGSAFAELVEGGRRRPAVQIVPAAFGERAGAVGAALGGAAGRAVVIRAGVVLPTFRDTSRRRLRRGGRGRGSRDRRAVLLRPSVAHGPARAAGLGPVPAPRRAGRPLRPAPRRRGHRTVLRDPGGPGRSRAQCRARRRVPGARPVWPPAGSSPAWAPATA